ncbi:hypothetical protein SDC9_73761 [bioreactor metagenome]|uniref:Uncharacterized protein n=1 Tax=bioreactor metagenome TaxID=1076179 RepID=A0A644YH78_9ZZZZ
MKVMTLKLSEKIYTTIKVTAYMAKEAMRINRDAVALGKLGNELRDEGKKASDAEKLDGADKVFDELLEISERKTALICEVYGNKFTADELEKALSPAEIDLEINKILMGVTGVIGKN